jgi:nucleoside-diphosphate-sugar epimerase
MNGIAASELLRPEGRGPAGARGAGRHRRKVAEAPGRWHRDLGDGSAIRSYTYVEDMVSGIYLLMQSELEGPTNIGCPEYVSVRELVETVADVAGKKIDIESIEGPVGVRSRNFSNERIYSIGWKSLYPLRRGIELTYPWIEAQVNAEHAD